MARFTIYGHKIDNNVIYLDSHGNAVRFIGGGSEEVFVYYIADGTRLNVFDKNNYNEMYIKNLEPIGILDSSLKHEKILAAKYTIGKIYAFTDDSSLLVSCCEIGVLEEIDDEAETCPFVDSNGHSWKYAKEINSERLGKVEN